MAQHALDSMQHIAHQATRPWPFKSRTRRVPTPQARLVASAVFPQSAPFFFFRADKSIAAASETRRLTCGTSWHGSVMYLSALASLCCTDSKEKSWEYCHENIVMMNYCTFIMSVFECVHVVSDL